MAANPADLLISEIPRYPLHVDRRDRVETELAYLSPPKISDDRTAIPLSPLPAFLVPQQAPPRRLRREAAQRRNRIQCSLN